MDVTRHNTNTIINQQIFALRLIIGKLNHAYNGVDVEWEDNGEWSSLIQIIDSKVISN